MTCPKDPQSQNRYAYVRNNPITRIDPTSAQECENPEDPFCGGCEVDPFLCFPIIVIPPVGGGTPENTRPFPWPQLPLGFFADAQLPSIGSR